ncbi:gamma-glutamylcyclotransferase-like isoform X2 [Dermacentor andersoni]|uniref:gamma-glutamylcyclotransferase-like isoform X2 n=1 Tax=Dermacentor andersoni TaxID=34620 RepID=UPI003B3AF532
MNRCLPKPVRLLPTARVRETSAHGYACYLSKVIYLQRATIVQYRVPQQGYYVGFVDYFKSWQGAAAILKKNAERTTHGVLWTLPKGDIQNLDRQEREYEAADVTVKLPSGDKVVCRTYFYHTSRPGKEDIPSLLYKAVIVAGAIEHKLPDSYVQELMKNPDNGKTQGSNIGVDIDKLRSCVNGYLTL